MAEIKNCRWVENGSVKTEDTIIRKTSRKTAVMALAQRGKVGVRARFAEEQR